MLKRRSYRKSKVSNEEEVEEESEGNEEFTTDKEGTFSLIQLWTEEREALDNWKKEIWINWKQEVADNGEKVGETHQEKEVIDSEKVKKIIAQEKKDREKRWQEE